MKRVVIAAGISLGTLLLLAVAGEFGFRMLAPAEARTPLENFRRYLLTGEMRGYEPRAYTVYQRPRGSPAGNAFGFNDWAWKRERTPGVPRVACLGGSTTEGGNSQGRKGSYPQLLERELERRTGRDFEVLNAGISGWTSAEMLVAWFLTVQDFQPDVVVLHEAVNDLEPRFWVGFQPDYSHWRRPIQTHPAQGLARFLASTSDLYLYFRIQSGKAPEILDVSTYSGGEREPLMAEGKLPAASSLAFRRNLDSIARDARVDGKEVVLLTLPTSPKVEIGAFWTYGVRENNEHLRALCAEGGYRLADAARVFEERPELAEQFVDLVHLQPGGNRVKAELVADALADWLADLSVGEARPPREQE